MDADEKMMSATLEALDFNFLDPDIQTSQAIEVIANQQGINYWELRDFYWEPGTVARNEAIRRFSREHSLKNKKDRD
jgi:hypothetical protein